MALNSQLLIVQILTSNVQVLILCLSYFITTVQFLTIFQSELRGRLFPHHRPVPTKIFDIPSALLSLQSTSSCIFYLNLTGILHHCPSQSSLDMLAWSHCFLKWVLCGHSVNIESEVCTKLFLPHFSIFE